MPRRQEAPPTTQPTAAGDDLVSMFEELGIPPEVLAELLAGSGGVGPDPFGVFTSSFADPTEQVFARRMRPAPSTPIFGTQVPQTSLTPRTGTERTIFGVDVPEFETVDSTQQVGSLLESFYQWDREDLLARQRQLYAAGFYGDVDIADVQWGQHDEDSFLAWAQAVTRAARFFAAGQKLTIDQVLDNAARDRLGAGADGDSSGPSIVQLSDPLALYQQIDQTAQSVLGRKATAQEQRMFVGMFHAMQRDAQLRAQNVSSGGQGSGALDRDGDGRLSQAEVDAALAERQASRGGGTVEVTQPDQTAQAEALLRQQNPTEAGAHDIATSFQQFLGLLGGVV